MLVFIISNVFLFGRGRILQEEFSPIFIILVNFTILDKYHGGLKDVKTNHLSINFCWTAMPLTLVLSSFIFFSDYLSSSFDYIMETFTCNFLTEQGKKKCLNEFNKQNGKHNKIHNWRATPHCFGLYLG